jgi:hypothetical protein
MMYEIFTAGSPQELAPLLYMDMIKVAFPKKRIYNSTGNSMEDIQALRESETMFAFVSGIPYGHIISMAGRFHELNHREDRKLNSLVCVVNDPARFNGREVIDQTGHLVTSVEEGIIRLREYFFDRDLRNMYHPGELTLLNIWAGIMNKFN